MRVILNGQLRKQQRLEIIIAILKRHFIINHGEKNDNCKYSEFIVKIYKFNFNCFKSLMNHTLAQIFAISARL